MYSNCLKDTTIEPQARVHVLERMVEKEFSQLPLSIFT